MNSHDYTNAAIDRAIREGVCSGLRLAFRIAAWLAVLVGANIAFVMTDWIGRAYMVAAAAGFLIWRHLSRSNRRLTGRP